ncbi:hypothetical protein P154DRAFT_566142 [Amniculicola lignicola CBS 123094]|uniref:CHAT domain-containing protein n=1 Tax=Amniculicola lignicola CBS 123094 TaxID=1392246 RepID=A0A6A5WFJ8_9PLEO|nr:hypothetical protein P154DRAFT_566142 [Amniculicola lignicola CBS 123094]
MQVLLRPIQVDNESHQIEVSFRENDRWPLAIPPYVVKFNRPEPIAGFEKLLRRHLEQYAQEEPFETRLAERVAAGIDEYARDLFDQLRLEDVVRKVAARVGFGVREKCSLLEICVLEEPGSWLADIHWELLECAVIRQLHPDISIRIQRISLTSSECEVDSLGNIEGPLNILVVVARPHGRNDIPYRNIILPLTNVSNCFPKSVLSVDIVRLGTWEALQDTLDTKPYGHYQIVHFDVHGVIKESRAYLCFENSDKMEAKEIGRTLRRHGVKGAIMNACRSAQSPGKAESSLAFGLLHYDLQFVIGMSYNIHQDAAKYFLQGLYSGLLIKRTTIAEAVTLGRIEMQRNPDRKGRFGMEVAVQDWFNPVLYLHNTVGGKFRMASGAQDLTVLAPLNDDWCKGLLGREYDIACIEKALSDSSIAKVRGFRGSGKSALIRHLEEWWVRSNFAEAIFVVDFPEIDMTDQDPIRIYPDEIFTQIDAILSKRNNSNDGRQKIYQLETRQRSDSPIEHGNVSADRDALIKRLRAAFIQHQYAIIIDRLDNVSSLAYGGTFNFYFWTEQMTSWLKDLHWTQWRSMALFSSLLEEEWLNQVLAEVIELDGLDLASATQYAASVINLTPYLETALSRLYLEKILQYFQCQPLALKIVLQHLEKSGLTTQSYFEKTLCSEIELPLAAEGEQKRIIMDFMLTCMAANAIPLPVVSATAAYCPQPYILDILAGKGPFDADPNPAKAFNSDVETFQDFAIARYIKPTRDAVDSATHLDTGYLLLHPLLSSFFRGAAKDIYVKGVEAIDMTFLYLVDYLAQRSEHWDAIDGFRHPGSIEIERNWFNILAALQYCVSRPYNWDKYTERLFDRIMSRTTVYVIDYKKEDWDVIAGIAAHGIQRIAKAFAHSEDILSTWWHHLHVGEKEASHGAKHILGKIIHPRKRHMFPLWLLGRVVKLYSFLRFYAYRQFDPQGWHYNIAILGLIQLKRQEGFQLDVGEVFSEQEAYIAAAEIAHQSSDHYPEGLAYLAKVDLSNVAEKMRDHLDLRNRDIHAELMGYTMDAESYHGDPEVQKLVEEAEKNDRAPLPNNRVARAIIARRAYAKALRTRDEDDVQKAKKLMYNELDLIKNPDDPYTIVVHRFLSDLFITEANWASSIHHLTQIATTLRANPTTFSSIINGSGGPNSYMIDLHQELARCFREKCDVEKADHHERLAQRLYEKREKGWTKKDRDKEELVNMLAAMQYALQTAELGDGPQGWAQQRFERRSVDGGRRGGSGAVVEVESEDLQ